MFLSESDFVKVIKSAPLVSIDLCIVKDSKILVGKRINSPAQDYYFVPGGRILKSELKKIALERILMNELGLSVDPNKFYLIKEMGVYEHFYQDNFLNNKDFNTHYIVLAYFIPFDSLTNLRDKITSEQHSDYIWFDIKTKNYDSLKIHNNTLEYLKNPIIKKLRN